MQERQTWVGLHDHANSATRWLDSQSSYTWLRAFERTKDILPIAFVRERQSNNNLEAPVRGVHYRFRKSGITKWVDDIVSENPSLVLYNICYYADGLPALKRLRAALPDAVHVIRIHHQVNYLAAHTGFREFLNACDVAIAPTEGQGGDVRKLGFSGPVYALPFGVNLEVMRRERKVWAERDIDLASATNHHPARNIRLVNAVYAILRQRGRRVENLLGFSSGELAKRLGNTKFFWQSSLTEASGSRILPEAIAAGCYPVVLAECRTTTELIQAHNSGKVLTSAIRFDFKTKKATYPPGIAEKLADDLDYLIAQTPGPYDGIELSADYNENWEIARLAEILTECSKNRAQLPQINLRMRIDIPNGEGVYVFNPAILQTDAGLLCIYRHVDGAGRRTLRRTTLNSQYAVGTTFDWSAEMEALGCPTKWHADPRLFRLGKALFLMFTTGHSETPNNMYLVELDEKGAPISKAIRVTKEDGRRKVEKNWGFFAFNNELYAIYSISPFVVLRVIFEDGKAVARPFAHHLWDSEGYENRFGELHGGAPPFLLGDNRYLIAQSNSGSAAGRTYRGTLLAFEQEPPFAPKYITNFPIFSLSCEERQCVPETKLNPSVRECFYPVGAIAGDDGRSVIITYGINDYYCGLRVYALCDLERCFVPIQAEARRPGKTRWERVCDKFQPIQRRLLSRL